MGVAAFALLLPGLFFGLPGGKAIVGGLRVLAGDVPYRDFWSMYAPGMFYLQALLFAVFGRTIVAQGVAVLLLRAVATGLVFSLARRSGTPRWVAAAIALIFAAMQWQTAPELDSYPPTLLLMVVALDRALRALFGQRVRRRLFEAGLALGLAAWFKHDVAAYLAVGLASGLILAWYASARRPEAWLHPRLAVRRLALGAAVGIAPMLLWIAWKAGADAWRDLIVFPATDFRLVLAEPFPGLLPEGGPLSAWLSSPGDLKAARDALLDSRVWILCHAPELVFLAGVFSLSRWRKRLDPIACGAACLFLASMPLYWVAAHTQPNTHLISMATLALLLAGLAWGRLGERGPLRRAAIFVSGIFYASGLVIFPAALAWTMASGWSKSRVLDLPVTGPIHVSGREHAFLRPIIDFVQANTRPEEVFYCGLARHDAVVIGNQRFYYLIDRPVATRYQEAHPAITDTLAVQEEMVREMEQRRLRCAVLWRFGRPDAVFEALKRERMQVLDDTGSSRLDEWLETHFETALERDEYSVVLRAEH